MTRWLTPTPIEIPRALLDWLGDPLLAELLARRGLTTLDTARAFLNPDDYEPASPADLPDLPRAVDRLSRAIEAGERICVWGDFDVDGQTSTALLVASLAELGANVRYYVPDRLSESHGIKLPALQRQIDAGLDLLLTCDTGITAFEAIEAARRAGVEVVVTDHHDLAETLPEAAAVVNPKRLPAGHPLRELPGVGVAFQLAQALYAAHDRPDDAVRHLDLVALGIVVDVATQTGDTRYLLQRGLAQLRRSRRTGLRALLALSNLDQAELTEEHVGFWLGPRLNALGRLGDANQGVELLTTRDVTRARILAAQLDALNERRKLLVDRVVAQALSLVEDNPALAEFNAIVLAARDWHAGVIGLAASRLTENFGKPAVLISTGPDGLGRGSARSVPGCDLHQAIKTQAGLLRSFGGHPMAAGLSLPLDNVDRFRQGLSDALAGCLAGRAEQTLAIDATLPLAEVTPELAARLDRLAPFGPGNPPVTLASHGLSIAGEYLFGRGREHRRLRLVDQAGHEAEALWWFGAGEPLPNGTFDLAFNLRLERNRPRGNNAARFEGAGAATVRLEWLAAREWQPVVVPLAGVEREIVDLRGEARPLRALASILPEAQVWLEGEAAPDLAGRTRRQLTPAGALVLWTTPPGADVLRQVLAQVRPTRLYLVARPCTLDTPQAFLPHLLGLVKYSLAHYEGRLDLEAVAEAMAHRLPTIELALRWLICQGRLRLVNGAAEESVWRVEAGRAAAEPAGDGCAALEEALQTILAETAAFRTFMRQARPGVWWPAGRETS